MEKKFEDYLKDSRALDVLDHHRTLQVNIDSVIDYCKILLPKSETINDIFIDFHLDKEQNKNVFETLYLFSENYLSVIPDFLKQSEVLIDIYPLKNKIISLEASISHYGYNRLTLLFSYKKEITIKAESVNCKSLKNIYNLYLKDNLIL